MKCEAYCNRCKKSRRVKKMYFAEVVRGIEMILSCKHRKIIYYKDLVIQNETNKFSRNVL